MSAGTKAILVGAAGVIGGVLLVVGILALADSGKVDVQLGDEEFEVGNAERFADEIAETGQPLIFQDLVGGDRDIWVQHLGEQPDEGWSAFEVRVPGDEECLTEWDADGPQFVSTCDDGVTFPADGEGLRQYDTRVEDGTVIVDLRG